MANAILNKNSSTTDDLLTAAAWSEAVAPSTSDTGKIGASAGITAPLNTSNNIGSMWLDSTYPTTTFAVTAGGNTIIFTVDGPVASGAPAYTVYVDAGKTLQYANRMQLSASRLSSHSIYVGAGGMLQFNQASQSTWFGSLQCSAGTSVKKYGPGVIYTGQFTSAFTGSWGAGTSLTIVDGEIRLSGASGTLPLGSAANTALTFDPEGNVGYTPKIGFVLGTNNLTGTTRTIPNNITVNTRGTIDVVSTFTATFTGTTSGSGTLTIAGAGTTSWSNTLSVPIEVTGNLSMVSTNNITSATITGTGTIAMNGGAFGSGSAVDASGHTGTISGSCTVSGGVSSFGSNFTGAVTISSGLVTFAGASSGSIASVGYADVTVTGSFTTSSGTTQLAGAGANAATLTFSGAGTMNAGRTLALQNSSVVKLSSGASVPVLMTATTDTTTVSLYSADASTNTYSGTLTTDRSSGSVNLRSAAGGTLVLSGTLTGSNAGRSFVVNSSSGDTGTVKVTGAGFTGASPVTVSYGKLQLAPAAATALGLGGGITTSSGASVELAAGATGPTQLTGNLTLASGSTLKFAA